MASTIYTYKGWTFKQVSRGDWSLRRLSDGFTTFHHSKGGCQAFIRRHGDAPNPDLSYEESLNNNVMFS